MATRGKACWQLAGEVAARLEELGACLVLLLNQVVVAGPPVQVVVRRHQDVEDCGGLDRLELVNIAHGWVEAECGARRGGKALGRSCGMQPARRQSAEESWSTGRWSVCGHIIGGHLQATVDQLREHRHIGMVVQRDHGAFWQYEDADREEAVAEHMMVPDGISSHV
eukprot:CAMPEP_0181177676 /NCGR_PEP_ID=MMETSP1096-20121128/5297_1 /TAXON_ID=156174 ORGANISM="Chrysochromulina ericina, Strain CCMP281" /NCGR_SAMPLE_ID=MMETSP1096 /ASSEMBLY_ACC=CAM_ASM_000453 /LENGTH=166 /DNA_ID=CAMNT_0023265861 /DNA_START=343 /DNA_END=840 /DNA_ORIENTATION=-